MFRTFHGILASRFSPFRTLSHLAANCVWLAGLVLIPAAANATTYTVTNLSDSGTGSLRAAITSANADPGSTIVFQSGLTGTIKLASSLPNITVSGSMTITGPGASVLTISGQNQYSLLAITSGTVTISGVTIANGFANSSGGYNGEGYGGAIYIVGGATLNVQNSVFSDNTTSNAGGGGAICNVGTLNVTNTTFSGNAVLGSSNYGGAIFNAGPLTISDSTFSGNFASGEGSAILNYAGAPDFGIATISNTTFANNNAGASAGALYNFSGATLTVSDSTFSGNLPANGGSIANGGTLTMTDSVLVEPSSGSSQCTTVPPATQCPANPSSPDANGNFDGLSTSLLLSSLGYYGGLTQTLVPLAGSPVICGAAKTGAKDVSGNPLTADQRGFGLDPSCTSSKVDAGSVQANYLTVTTTADPGSGTCSTTCALRDAITAANTAGHGDIDFANGVTGTITLQSSLPDISGVVNIVGPGASQLTISGANAYRVVYNDGTLSLTGLAIANGDSALSTSPSGSAGSGGAILNAGSLALENTVLTNNSAGTSGKGGAIRNTGVSLAVNDSTFSANTSGSSGDGGAIENEGPLTISNSTFSTNTANSGSAIYNNSAGQLSASYSTFSGNNASNSAAIFNNTGATLTADNDTLSGNTNGGIFSSGSTLSVTNTILAEASECSGADCPTSGGGNIYADSGLTLAALGNYGGPTQTLLPLPGSSAICAGSASLISSAVTSDQRGFSNENTSYTGYSATTPCVDAGAVQTNYTAASFNNTSYAGTVNVAGTTPPVIVSLTENAQNVGGVPVTLQFTGTGTATGTSATTVAGSGATFSNLSVNSTGTDSISVSIPVVTGTMLTAGPETLTVGMTTPLVGVDYSTAGSIAFGTPETFYGYVPSTATGTVTFYNNGSTVLGSGTVSGGIATFSTSTLAVGSYSITAAYSGDSNYNPNTSGALTLTVSPPPATMASPAPGSTLTSASTTFTWNPASGSVTGYYLWVGTSLGAADLVNIGPLSGTSATVTLPTTGATIYVRLWTVFNGTNYLYNDYTYIEVTQSATAMTSPTPGSTLTSASTTFTWNPGSAGTTGYYLWIGTSLGTANLVNIGPLSGTSATVTLPATGATIYVRLWTVFNGTTLLSNDYTYKEVTQSATTMASPANGSTLTSASTTFTWNAGSAGTTGYYLWIGTSLGTANLVNIGPLSGTSATVTLPTTGATIYVRLWTVFNGTTYLYNDYTYKEVTQ